MWRWASQILDVEIGLALLSDGWAAPSMENLRRILT
jgi:hypothetical protein